jgi:hypothetical protein
VNEHEQEKFEADLRRIRPARLPEDFMTRLQAARPEAETLHRTQSQPTGIPLWQNLLRWLAPVVALGAIVLVVTKVHFKPKPGADAKPLADAAYGMKADDVRVNEELVSSFDVVAKLPNGEPVRFRCLKWKDQLVVSDKRDGIEIEQNSPRVEVVPVRVETY